MPGLIRSWDGKSLGRGEAIYRRVCSNCHGTMDHLGSMPTSLRFAEGQFKNGSDPWHMYQTLTHGFGMMTPQSWMVPEQKYDVIHYIRETYLKPHNPSQYVNVDAAYLAGLPPGKSRGPKPSNIEPWVNMNYGPSLTLTLEVGDQGNFAYKGIAVRLDNGPGGISRGHSGCSTTKTRSASPPAGTEMDSSTGKASTSTASTSFIRTSREPCASSNPSGRGWANPETGSFDDPRMTGRDGKPYGPLPRSWARYRGNVSLRKPGDSVVHRRRRQHLEMPSYELTPGQSTGFHAHAQYRQVVARFADAGGSGRNGRRPGRRRRNADRARTARRCCGFPPPRLRRR